MTWTPVTIPGAPAPKGAYSPAVRAGDLVFVSGQVPRDPITGALVGTDVPSQTAQVIANIAGALSAAGARLEDIVAMTVYLQDITQWGEFNEAYRTMMPQPFPTRTALGAELNGFLVEISCIAYVGR